MASIFDIIPNNFFNPLSSNSNYRANAALFQFIYEQYDNEISYRIKRNILRDEMAYFISEHSEEFLADYDMSNKTCQDISSDYLRRFSSKDVGWLEEEFDESTFEKYIVITEQGVMLAELLFHLERPERDELSSYMYNIYRNVISYVRGDTKSEGKNRFIREGEVTSYIAMEFWAPLEKQYLVVGVCIEYVNETSNTKKWFVFKNTRLDDCRFYTEKDKKVTVYSRRELVVKGKKVLASEFMNRDKGTEQVLREKRIIM